jgi:hypothetical protein
VPMAAVVFPLPGPVLTMINPRRTSVMVPIWSFWFEIPRAFGSS